MLKTMMTIAALSFAAPVLAEPVTVNVPTAGIDLTTAQGRAELDKRAARIAVDKCGIASPTDLKGRKLVRECREAVMIATQRHAAQLRSADSAR